MTNTQSVTTPWTISSGLLIVNGSLANATSVTVSGGTLGGTGTVSTTNVNAGGTLAPGNPTNPTGTLNIAGSLTFASASAFYLVNVVGASASSTNVTGTATLAGNSRSPPQTLKPAPTTFCTRQAWAARRSQGLPA